MSRIGAVVLAAGNSRRMGTQKLLLPLAGRTVIGHVVSEVARGGVSPVVVVVGRDEAGVRAALAGRAVTFVRNPDVEGDMLSSVRCGLAVVGDCDGAFVVLGDQPAVRGEWLADMARVFRESGGDIVVPVHTGRRGHPLLIAARLFNDVMTKFDGAGLRGLLETHPRGVVGWHSPDDAVLMDMDRPDDYRRELKRHAR